VELNKRVNEVLRKRLGKGKDSLIPLRTLVRHGEENQGKSQKEDEKKKNGK